MLVRYTYYVQQIYINTQEFLPLASFYKPGETLQSEQSNVIQKGLKLPPKEKFQGEKIASLAMNKVHKPAESPLPSHMLCVLVYF